MAQLHASSSDHVFARGLNMRFDLVGGQCHEIQGAEPSQIGRPHCCLVSKDWIAFVTRTTLCLQRLVCPRKHSTLRNSKWLLAPKSKSPPHCAPIDAFLSA